jgi:hypothetical protein
MHPTTSNSRAPVYLVSGCDCCEAAFRMANFQELRDFDRRFDTMSVDELERWKRYWTQHAQGLVPQVRKQAMKRVYDIERAIQQRSQVQSDGE